jgi:hypothetical protein
MAVYMKRVTLAAFITTSLALPILPAIAREDIDGIGGGNSARSSVDAENVAPDMTASPRLAIGGYDTVAYHTMGKAIPGNLEYQTVWHDARWQFSSRENLALFIKDPERYAAQYDGFCAMGVADGSGHKDTVDPEAFTIVNGKLYLNHTKYWVTEWRKDAPGNISIANKNWEKVMKMPEPDK